MSDRDMVNRAIIDCDDISAKLKRLIERFDTNTVKAVLPDDREFLVKDDRRALADLIEAVDTVRACRIHRI